MYLANECYNTLYFTKCHIKNRNSDNMKPNNICTIFCAVIKNVSCFDIRCFVFPYLTIKCYVYNNGASPLPCTRIRTILLHNYGVQGKWFNTRRDRNLLCELHVTTTLCNLWFVCATHFQAVFVSRAEPSDTRHSDSFCF